MHKKRHILIGGILLAVALIGSLVAVTLFKPESISYESYNGRVFYEIFVRAFYDSDGDRIGDLQGVTQKLDYLENLGVRGIWLMPITKATSYHGYDTEDYYAIDEDYGNIEDLKVLLEEAHKRDIKVVMDLVINHTSWEHPYFKEARENENSPYRNYYIWTKDMEKKLERSPMSTLAWAQNGNKDELYYAAFYEGMPDLNYDNPKVEEEMQQVAKYYLDLGIDGFRLDAAKWIFNEKEKNIEFWNRFQEYVHSINEEAVLIGEVWDAPYNICEYAGVLDSFFDFNIGGTLTNAINSRTLSNVVYTYQSIEEMYKEEDHTFVLAPFLSNHDQTRVMNVLGEDVNKMKVAGAIYLNLPGTPYLYYGEELGMTGTKPDERIREPFLWSSTDEDQNTNWIDSSNPKEKVALDKQLEDKDSLYQWYKALINLRNEHKALSVGELEEVNTPHSKIFGMKRIYEEEEIYILASLSDQEESIELEEGIYKVLLSSEGLAEGVEQQMTSKITLVPNQILIVLKN